MGLLFHLWCVIATCRSRCFFVGVGLSVSCLMMSCSVAGPRTNALAKYGPSVLESVTDCDSSKLFRYTLRGRPFEDLYVQGTALVRRVSYDEKGRLYAETIYETKKQRTTLFNSDGSVQLRFDVPKDGPPGTILIIKQEDGASEKGDRGHEGRPEGRPGSRLHTSH